jgi:hypothetical protein
MTSGAGGPTLSGSKEFCTGLAMCDAALVTVSGPDGGRPLLVDVALNAGASTGSITFDASAWSSPAFADTATGTVVYLEATIDAQLKRTKPSRNRPLLMDGDPRATLERLMSIRRPFYESIADLRFDTTGRQVGAVAADVRAALDART